MDGQAASPPGPATGRGRHPSAATRHKLISAPRAEEKTISLLSLVHAGDPAMGRWSKVNRFTWLPFAAMTQRSLLTPATLERMNARCLPSGEYMGERSIQPGVGEDISRRLESAIDKTEIQARV